MATERIQRQIDLLLDQIEQAAAQLNWPGVRDRAQAVLAYDPENQDALAFLAAAERAIGAQTDSTSPSRFSRGGSYRYTPSFGPPRLFRQRPLPGQTIPGGKGQEEGLPGP